MPVDARDTDGRTPLLRAAEFGQVETLDQIVADVQALLSFARGGMIRLARRDVRKVDKTLLQTQLYPVSEVKPFRWGQFRSTGHIRA